MIQSGRSEAEAAATSSVLSPAATAEMAPGFGHMQMQFQGFAAVSSSQAPRRRRAGSSPQ
eukprot:SAG22_NODE_16865_length_316_cov_0.686636_1_plen_59_part_10